MNTVFEDQELKQKLEEAMKADQAKKQNKSVEAKPVDPKTGSYEGHRDQVERQAL